MRIITSTIAAGGLSVIAVCFYAAAALAFAEEPAGGEQPAGELPLAVATGSAADPGVAVAQAIPFPRERPLMVEPSAEATGEAATTGGPLELLKGLNMSPDATLEAAAAGLVRPDRQLQIQARLAEAGELLATGLVWRVYRAQPAVDGSFELVEETQRSKPVFTLPADDYIVHVSYGLANTATRVSLRDGPADETLDLNAGGLRLSALGVLDEPIAERQLVLSIYSSEQDEYGQRKRLVDQAPPGKVIRLNAGTYHVVSRYGDANSVMRADLRVQPGQLTDAAIRHRAAAVTFKLVNEAGGEALANTAWSILSPGGDVVKESYGAFPTHVLAAGEYSVVARHESRLYNRDFVVEPGLDGEVEIVAQ